MSKIENMKKVLEKIKENQKIIIFRHFRPDGDAVGSTKGLQAILKATYPEKEIYLQNAGQRGRTACRRGIRRCAWDCAGHGHQRAYLQQKIRALQGAC